MINFTIYRNSKSKSYPILKRSSILLIRIVQNMTLHNHPVIDCKTARCGKLQKT